MLLEISNASVSRGGHTVLEDFSFSIRGTEKIAVVGKNGAGKSTLLEVLDGSCRPDTRDGHPEAEVHVSRAVTIGRFSQTAAPEDAEKTPEVFVREAAIQQAIPEQSAYYASFVSDFYKGEKAFGIFRGRAGKDPASEAVCDKTGHSASG